jgi:hypothetical protein
MRKNEKQNEIVLFFLNPIRLTSAGHPAHPPPEWVGIWQLTFEQAKATKNTKIERIGMIFLCE